MSDLIDRVVLPPEQAADLSIASDRSFVQTSSGPAARELKRQFDYLLGVSPSRRSPYAITAFVSQHGRQMFRVGSVPESVFLLTPHTFSETGILLLPPQLPARLAPHAKNGVHE